MKLFKNLNKEDKRMSSYESLLETYNEEEKFSNVSFEEMGNILESLTEFVNEEVEITVEMTLQEAEEVANDEEKKSAKFGAAVKKTIERLIAKLTEFIKKIGDAVKAFVNKARMITKQGGNAALKKMLSNNNITIRKAITVKTTNYAAVGSLYNIAGKAASDVSDAVKSVNINTVPATVPEVPASVENAVKAFAERFDASDLVKSLDLESGKTVASAYNDCVKPWLDQVNKGIETVEKVCKGAQANASKLIKDLKKNKENPKTVNADAIGKISKLSSAAMQISTNTVRFANTILTLATKNAAKLALAAGANAPAAAKDKAKEKGAELKGKAGEAKAAAKNKLQGAKATVDAAKAGMSGKKAGSIQKQED
jgi:hypothetical protein